MYSGTTLTRFSGRILGAHQKIDRVARKHVGFLLRDDRSFPGTRLLLHFEGKNGPDGIKRKSPAKDEPWHYYDPFNDDDTQLLHIIQEHYDHLVLQLKAHNRERAAFEAAWLAHALVDGLTPAHHFPYEAKVSELRGGKSNESRTTIKEKLVMHGDTPIEKLKNNWKMWGGKGLMTTHGTFEWGVATMLAPLTLAEAQPTPADLRMIEKLGVVKYFERTAHKIARLDLYTQYYEQGWTHQLAYRVRHKLGPILVRTVTLSWYLAAKKAGLARVQQ